MLPHGVLGKSKTASLLHVHPPSLFALALSARLHPVHQFVCVSYCMRVYIYTRPHSLGDPPPQKNTHKVVYLRTHRLQKKRKDSNKERETKRDREEVFGGWSLEICSGWLSGPHVQVLEACLLRSLRTCPVTSKNGMFQAQRSRDN